METRKIRHPYMELIIEGQGLVIDFVSQRVLMEDVMRIVNAKRVQDGKKPRKWSALRPDFLKGKYMEAFRKKVREGIVSLSKTLYSDPASGLYVPSSYSLTDKQIDDRIWYTTEDGTFIHPVISLEIVGSQYPGLRIEMQAAFIENKIIEHRAISSEEYTNFKYNQHD